MTKSNVIDFDAWRSEQKSEPKQLRIGGKVYDLPSSLPVTLALDIARLQEADSSADVSEADIRKLSSALFGGTDKLEEILREGAVTIDEMPELVKQILLSYGGGSAPNRTARRARAAQGRKTSTSSRTGRSSRQTS